MWRCKKCGEDIEDLFDACWACGTSREGVEDPLFKPVVDQPEASTGLSDSPTVRGLWTGAVVSVVIAFLHPFIMLFVAYLADPAAIGPGALSSTFLFGFVWAAFALIGGGIAGAMGARAQTERAALIGGVLSCVLFHFLFLIAATNGLTHWPRKILLGSLSIAAFTGALAGFVGFVVGKKRGAKDGGNDAPWADRQHGHGG